MTAITRAASALLIFLGGFTILGVDLLSLVWVNEIHGLGWAVGAFVSFIGLLIAPFMAGYGLALILGWGAFILGYILAGFADLLEQETA